MAEQRPISEFEKSLRNVAWLYVAIVAGLIATGRYLNSKSSSTPQPPVAKAQTPKDNASFQSVSSERVTAFVDNYTKRLIRLEGTVPEVNSLEAKRCGRKLIKPSPSVTNSNPNLRFFVNILSRDRVDGYQFISERQNGEPIMLDADQSVIQGCVGLSSADQDIRFEKVGDNWFMYPGYTDKYGGQEIYREYSTISISETTTLTPTVFSHYSHVANLMLTRAFHQDNLSRASLRGYPN